MCKDVDNREEDIKKYGWFTLGVCVGIGVGYYVLPL